MGTRHLMTPYLDICLFVEQGLSCCNDKHREDNQSEVKMGRNRSKAEMTFFGDSQYLLHR